MGGLIEIPMGDTLRLRGEAAVGLWHFDGYSSYRIAGSGMRRHRLAVSVLRSRNPASPNGGAEVQLHAMGQPKAPDAVTSIPMLGAHVSAVLKYRLP